MEQNDFLNKLNSLDSLTNEGLKERLKNQLLASYDDLIRTNASQVHEPRHLFLKLASFKTVTVLVFVLVASILMFFLNNKGVIEAVAECGINIDCYIGSSKTTNKYGMEVKLLYYEGTDGPGFSGSNFDEESAQEIIKDMGGELISSSDDRYIYSLPDTGHLVDITREYDENGAEYWAVSTVNMDWLESGIFLDLYFGEEFVKDNMDSRGGTLSNSVYRDTAHTVAELDSLINQGGYVRNHEGWNAYLDRPVPDSFYEDIYMYDIEIDGVWYFLELSWTQGNFLTLRRLEDGTLVQKTDKPMSDLITYLEQN
ncbi:MAG: hypothetical protein QY318_04770 [Candidatus Dojkabacteria bacterium]|nr:MAG: hypothetical protein QY318_04770 [Candidatus Dojkabacteria bacterium]